MKTPLATLAQLFDAKPEPHFKMRGEDWSEAAQFIEAQLAPLERLEQALSNEDFPVDWENAQRLQMARLHLADVQRWLQSKGAFKASAERAGIIIDVLKHTEPEGWPDQGLMEAAWEDEAEDLQTP